MTVDIHTLVGAYALDAVDDIERAAFDRHLRECEACRDEVSELQITAARLADGAWSVPPPALRENVLAAIAETRQIAPAPTARNAARRAGSFRIRLVAAAAAVVAAATAGTAVYAIQDQRVRHEQSNAEAARAHDVQVQAILSAPDLVVRQEALSTGGHVTVASSRLHDAGVILLAATAAPASGKVFETWTVGAQGPVPVGTTDPGQTAVVQVVQGLPDAAEVGVTIEPTGGSKTPTQPMVGGVKLT